MTIIRRIGQTVAALGLAGLLTAAPMVANTAQAGNITIENTVKGQEGEKTHFTRTRTKASYGPVAVAYDANHGANPEEWSVWADVANFKGYSISVLGEVDNDGESVSGDYGLFVGKRFGGLQYNAFALPIAEEGVKPLNVYQLAVADTTGNWKAVGTLFDDRNEAFGMGNLDFRSYVTAKYGNFFGGVGTNLKAGNIDLAQGSAGYVDDDFGSLTAWNYDREYKEFWSKTQNGHGNPSSGFFGMGVANLWQDMQVGMRDLSVPYFSSPITKGEITTSLEVTINPTKTCVEGIVAKNLGVLRAGLGTNYNKENGKGDFSGVVHVTKDVNLKGVGKIYFEGKHNTRNSQTGVYVSLSREL
ncbi:MAG: hypothetical protein KKB31_04680 [Nanoarchaeota archaeon]|nr:hypothetical protein [Nanoarchaeota archaeon]